MQQQFKASYRAIRFVFLLCGLAISSWAPMVPFAKEGLNLNEAELGMVLLAFAIGALISMPLTGWLVQRFGSRKLIVNVGCGLIGFLPLLPIAPTSELLSLALLLFGAASGTLNVAINSQAVALEVKSKMPLMSGFHCLFSLGGLFGAGFISAFLEFGFSLFVGSVAMSSLMLLILATQSKHLLPAQDDIKATSQATFTFPRGKVLIFGLFCFIFFLGEGAMLDWSAVFLESTHEYSPAVAGAGYAIFSVAMAFGRYTGDKVIKRFGPVAVLQMGSFLAASGMLIAAHIGSGIELLGFLLIGLGASNVVPILFSAAGRLPDVSSSLSLTVVTTCGYAGILLGPAMIGFIAQATSLSIALTGVALLLSVVTLGGRIVVTEAPSPVLQEN